MPTVLADDFDRLKRSDWSSFGMRSGFISKSGHARLQVSVCSSYDLCHPGQHPGTQTGRHTDRQNFDEL